MKIYCVKILDISDGELEKLGLSISEDKKTKSTNLFIKETRLEH